MHETKMEGEICEMVKRCVRRGVNRRYPQFYKRIAKPRNALPNTAAMLSPAPGRKAAGAAPMLGGLVAVEPPKPVTGILFVAEPVGALVEDIVERREELPR